MLLALASGLPGTPAGAHNPITSKYTYNEHVFPILRDHCGRCHADGGVAPMSLLTFAEARPWAESIREELLADRMPPWYGDLAGGAPVLADRAAHALSARELDTIIVWATGGTPEGDPTNRPAPLAGSREWPAGTPDLIVPMPAPHTLPTDQREETYETVLATGLAETRWLKAVDLLAGSPSMVHNATITIDGGPVVAAWVPGDDPFMLPHGSGYRLEAGAKLHLRVHYKKSWRDEHSAQSDRSLVGLYFAGPATSFRDVHALTVDAAPPGSPASHVETSPAVPAPVTVLAIRPRVDRPYGQMRVDARTSSGALIPVLRLRAARPEWPRRYWLRTPVHLPAGSRIEISASPLPPDLDQPTPPAAHEHFGVALDVTSP